MGAGSHESVQARGKLNVFPQRAWQEVHADVCQLGPCSLLPQLLVRAMATKKPLPFTFSRYPVPILQPLPLSSDAAEVGPGPFSPTLLSATHDPPHLGWQEYASSSSQAWPCHQELQCRSCRNRLDLLPQQLQKQLREPQLGQEYPELCNWYWDHHRTP